MLKMNHFSYRFSAEERRRQKKSLFQLGDEEETLTHFGKSIADIDRFDDPRDEEVGAGDDEKRLDCE